MRRLRTYTTDNKVRPCPRPAPITAWVLDTDAFLVATDVRPAAPSMPVMGKPTQQPAQALIWWGARPAVRH